MVVASCLLIATSRLSSFVEYSYPKWLHNPIMPIGLSLPQNNNQIHDRSVSERMNSTTRVGRCGIYSAVITSVRDRITRSPKPSGREISAGRALSRLRGPHDARRRYVGASVSER